MRIITGSLLAAKNKSLIKSFIKKDTTMKVIDYLKKLKDITEHEFMSDKELVDRIGICQNTLIRARRNPDKCSMHTAKKFKKFVEEWEATKLSVIH